AAQVGERAHLLADVHGVGQRLLLAPAEQLRRAVALPLEELDVDLAAVELEMGVEVLRQGDDRVLDRFLRRDNRLAGQLGEDLTRRRTLELSYRDRDVRPGHALERGATVVAAEGQARWRVRIAGHLLRSVLAGLHAPDRSCIARCARASGSRSRGTGLT